MDRALALHETKPRRQAVHQRRRPRQGHAKREGHIAARRAEPDALGNARQDRRTARRQHLDQHPRSRTQPRPPPPPGPRRLPSECVDSDCEPAFEELSPWLKSFPSATYLRDPVRRRAEYAAEDARRAVIEGDHDLSLNRERDLFLVRGVLPRLREAWRP